MEITIQDIIKKHETNINTENMSKKLRETILFSDNPQNKPWFNDKTITPDNIPQPTHTTNQNREEYTYKFKDYTLNITYNPQDYRSMNITITKQTPEDQYQDSITYEFDYKGEQWGIKY